MKKLTNIVFMGNAASPHVRHWSMLLSAMSIEYAMVTVHQGSLLQDKKVAYHFLWLKKLGRAGDYFSYILLGLLFRMRGWLGFEKTTLLHAHNTSGYGLAAWLSGLPYIVTTYGSEIFSAEEKSALYKFLLRRILAGAITVTATTDKMADALRSQFWVPADKIHVFSLGVSPVFFYDEGARRKLRAELGIDCDGLVWIYNRRITPLYNTLNVVRAFQEFSRERSQVFLMLLEGDSDKSYLDKVLAAVSGDKKIIFVPGFCEQAIVRAYLSASDFAFSVPDTDQMSSSILESIACGCRPVLLNNPAYADILDSGNAIIIESASKGSIHSAFVASEVMAGNPDEKGKRSEIAGISDGKFDSGFVGRKIKALYESVVNQL